MPPSPDGGLGPPSQPPAPPAPLEQARHLFRAAASAEAASDRARQILELRTYLDFLDAHRGAIDGASGEMVAQLDEAAMTLYRLSEPELSLRAVDLGLSYSRADASLLHHKAMLLMALNRDVDRVMPLLEEAVRQRPGDKAIWATTGDALKLLGRSNEAAEAYLKAQQLDANSTQYVEKALRIAPNHPAALRMCLALARAHGGSRQALEACEALLSASPSDPELLFARVELRTAVGEYAQALDAVAPAREKRPGDPRLAMLAGRIHLALGHPLDALEEYRMAAEAAEKLTVPEIADLAERVDPLDERAELAIRVREALFTRDPRNLANLLALRQLAQRTRRFDLGVNVCRKILEISPGNLEATRALAEFQLTSGAVDEGFGTYRGLLRDHPEEIGEAGRAIEAARVAHREDLIAEFARAAIAQDPSNTQLQSVLAEALRARGEIAEALEVYRALAEAQPRSEGPWLAQRELLKTLHRLDELRRVDDHLFEIAPQRTEIAFERAERALAEASAQPPASPERTASARTALLSYERALYDPARAEPSLRGVAASARLLGDHARARKAYEELLAMPGRSRDPTILKELGHAEREAGELVDAEHAYELALSLGMEDSDLLWGEVEVLVALGDEAKALRYLEVLLRRQPDDPTFMRRKGQLLLKTGRRAEGAWVLRAAAEKAPGDHAMQLDVATALRAGGSYPDAIDFYARAIALEPTSRPARLGLAETLNLAGRHNEAIPIVDELLHEDPNDPAGWRVRSDACRALGRTSELAYSLKAILLLDPQQSQALVEKYRLHLSLGEKVEALECLGEFLASGGPEGRDAGILLEAGDLATQLGRTDEALRWYERAQEADPSQAFPIGLRRARVRLASGRPDLALEVLDAVAKGRSDETDPADALALLRAEILMALERAPEAEGAYRKVLERDPRGLAAISGLAKSLLEQGKHADARSHLIDSIPKVPPAASLFLLLAEAESGLGDLPAAVRALEKGVEVLPRSSDLWARLGELEIARSNWDRAAEVLQRAITEGGEQAELLLKAGSVAEKRRRPTEALSLYDRATQLAPHDKFTWSARGLALLAQGRPDEASDSFAKALEIDGEFDAARQGRKVAAERSREQQIGRFARDALLLEARLHRTVNKNDLFVSLHIPFEYLEPVLAELSKAPAIDLAALSEEELAALESASCQLVTAALDRRSSGLDRRGFTLADVAVLSPPNRPLPEIQRLFGYFKAVLEVELTPENLRLSPDVEELARRALLLPAEQRTLFGLVRTLKVGIFRARLIKVVESAGGAVHAPMPSLDFAPYSPDLSDVATPAEEGPASGSVEAAAPEAAAGGPAHEHASAAPSARRSASPAEAATAPRPIAPAARCVGCGGLASIVHDCGAPVCAHCILEFRTCPKCRQPAFLPIPPAPGQSSAPSPHAAVPERPEPHLRSPSGHAPTGRGTLETLRAVASAAKPARRSRPPEPSSAGRTSPAPPVPAPAKAKPAAPEPHAADEPPRTPHPRPKADEVPRL